MKSGSGLTSHGSPGVRQQVQSDQLLSGIPEWKEENALLIILKSGKFEYDLAGKSLECFLTSTQQWNTGVSGRQIPPAKSGVLLGRNVCRVEQRVASCNKPRCKWCGEVSSSAIDLFWSLPSTEFGLLTPAAALPFSAVDISLRQSKIEKLD